MEANSVKVSILGQSYNIKGDAPPEYIDQLADFVNEKMEEVRKNISGANSLQIAILVSLNIADEFFQVRKLNHGIDGAIEEKTNELISMLDEGLIGDIFSGSDRITGITG